MISLILNKCADKLTEGVEVHFKTNQRGVWWKRSGGVRSLRSITLSITCCIWAWFLVSQLSRFGRACIRLCSVSGASVGLGTMCTTRLPPSLLELISLQNVTTTAELLWKILHNIVDHGLWVACHWDPGCTTWAPTHGTGTPEACDHACMHAAASIIII